MNYGCSGPEEGQKRWRGQELHCTAYVNVPTHKSMSLSRKEHRENLPLVPLATVRRNQRTHDEPNATAFRQDDISTASKQSFMIRRRLG